MEGSNWDNKAGNMAIEMLNEINLRIKEENPVKRYWHVPSVSGLSG